ncbi:MAG: hypothetical protein JWR67_2590 [Mucilaginibacter sp.]|nr:hypothetical protein [Mucilaginibacter sp.]
MKKTILNLLILISGVSIILLSSCRLHCVRGSGNPGTETRKISDFTKIDVSGEFRVNLKQDSSSSLTITADDNLLKYIKTTVSDGKLRIETKKNICSRGEMTVNIGIRNIKEMEASGAVEVTSDGKINTQDIHFKLSGATKLTMDLNAANVNTEGSGATKITLTGQASSHNIELSGVGKLNALDFVVGNYNISTSGASKCQINVLNSLNIHTSGASKIQYRGNPKDVNNDKSGASSVEKVN